MAIEVFSPETAYATKSNLKYPGSAAQATAAIAVATSRFADAFAATGITVTIPGTAIVAAT